MISPSHIAGLVPRTARRIEPHVRRTPIEESLHTGSDAYLKCENFQVTGSFKARGALAKLTSLSLDELSKGVVTASTGNHGAAISYGAKRLGATATVVVPEMTTPSKLAVIEALGGHIEIHGSDSVEAESEARRLAAHSQSTYVPPYNDQDVIAGQGTIGLEIAEDLDVDAVVIAVGGGGLVSGVASYLKHVRPDTEVVACSPLASAVMAKSIEAGEILDIASENTISDGTHGGVEQGSVTFDLCRELIDRFVLVTEDEIVDAMRTFISQHRMLIEGSAGVALASYNKIREELAGKKTVIVLCGANISMDQLRGIL